MLVFIGFEGEVGTIVRSVNVRADKDWKLDVIVSILDWEDVTEVKVRVSTGFYVGGENRLFILNFMIVPVGISILVILDTVTILDTPLHTIPLFIYPLRLLHTKLPLNTNLRVLAAMSSIQESEVGKLTKMLPPAGIELVNINETIRLAVVLTILGENVKLHCVNIAGVKLSAANGSYAE